MVSVDISPKNDGGVLKEIIKEGIGDETAPPGSNVTVHYTGTLLDGSKFDSSKDRNEPFTFELQKRTVIKAWDIGVATMKKGEVAMFICDPKYAYGAKGSPPTIPPNATLKFEIEMIDWTDEDLSPEKDRSIQKSQITKGKKYSVPTEGSLMSIHLTGMYDGKVFEDRDVQFCLGEGEDSGIVEGVEKALSSFKIGETSKVKLASKYAFKDVGKPELGIPPNATVEYILELKNFEKAVEFWTLKDDERIEQAKIFKEKGTNYFKKDKYYLAITMYNKITEVLTSGNFDGSLKEEKDSLMLSAYLNLALCYLKTDKNVEAKNACNQALELKPNNEKALYRRGQAYLALASPEIAIADFQEVLKIEPKNTAAVKQIGVCNNLIKKHLTKEKNLYANMFEKFAQQDKQ
ncbi:PREDICTED: FK506-binding protein 59 isoform X2 [Dufourea novaeangliae]|nr:PREDICTED: FK506-binding protein 59 isoform X2 [Dufourea novaeangliae]